ncbi:hypothetical protein [uncultured Dokdonia sp.]|uniref:hypothetical protein n=1 Tax=uncultured Dokdonia sp. TaxID=575653 RepID=UPI00263186FB|nr:hypothetical protein [uncultured Dokdonia sp.]
MENHKPYHKQFKHPHDFEVEYQVLDELAGGKKTPPYQGIRWDFWYDYNGKHEEQLFMIWPEFLDENGKVRLNTKSCGVSKFETTLL